MLGAWEFNPIDAFGTYFFILPNSWMRCPHNVLLINLPRKIAEQHLSFVAICKTAHRGGDLGDTTLVKHAASVVVNISKYLVQHIEGD
jgi:hypothetical protein